MCTENYQKLLKGIKDTNGKMSHVHLIFNIVKMSVLLTIHEIAIYEISRFYESSIKIPVVAFSEIKKSIIKLI